MRKAIDDYYADTNAYPIELEELVRMRYLRSVPADPLTDSRESWRLVRLEKEAGDDPRGIIDIRSGSDDVDGDGVAFAEW